jgi:hypothetical protein
MLNQDDKEVDEQAWHFRLMVSGSEFGRRFVCIKGYGQGSRAMEVRLRVGG